jgi:predicted  nucleic acid-binding Zn-ribbon protein
LCDSLQSQLADANADIQDYTESSKELQDELEKELQRMEKGEREMRKGLEEARGETDDWKVRFLSRGRGERWTTGAGAGAGMCS